MKKNKMKLMAIGCALTFAVAVTGCSKQSSTKETAVVETESKTSIGNNGNGTFRGFWNF